MYLQKFQETFTPKWREWVDAQIRDSRALTQDAAVQQIFDLIAQLLHAPGKYVRPALVHLIRDSFDPSQKQDMRLGFFVEAFHLFALIHDDIIDKAAIRRGVPTVHSALFRSYAEEKRHGDLVHLSNAQALLAGDLVYTWALELLASISGDRNGVLLQQHLYTMAKETVVGQCIDVDLMSSVRATDTRVDEKMFFKTVSYTFIRPLQTGAIAGGGGTPEVLAYLADVGTALGYAFQMQDDLIDVLQPSTQSGKVAFADILDRQHTFISQYIEREGTPQARAAFAHVFETGQIDDEQAFRAMIMDSGAVVFCREKIADFYKTARQLLGQEGIIPDSARKELLDVVSYLESH